MDKIKNYILEWNKEEGIKPQNNPEFISNFLEFAKSADSDHWEFDGDNGYCGCTAILHEHPRQLPAYGLGFELAYGKGFVKVFTGSHGGYWTPEYINLEGEAAKELLDVIRSKIIEWAGFDS